MPTLTLYGEAYSCAKAQKGADFVRLLDDDNDILFFADGITDFSPYVLTDGEWESPMAVVAPIVGAYAALEGTVVVLTTPGSVKVETGLQVNFKAPCDCTTAEAIRLNGVNYNVCDSLGRIVTGKGGVWSAGEVVSVILDAESEKAFIQNAATLSQEELLSKETAAKLGLSGADAIPDKAFEVVASYVLAGGSTTVIVTDEDGRRLAGVKLSGAVGQDGGEVTTDGNGVAMCVVKGNVEVTFVCEYADIPDHTETLTPNFETVNTITVTMPYAATEQVLAFTESGSLKFRRSRTVDLSVIGGGTGGTGGTGGASSSMGQPHGNSGRGGAGGAGGSVYNTNFSVEAETEYALAIGAGGVGGAGGERNLGVDENVSGYSGESGTAGGVTTFVDISSASGAATNIPFDDSTLSYGGNGGKGGDGAASTGNSDGSAGSVGVRAGGTGGTGGNSYGNYYGSVGTEGGPGGGGGGGGGGGSGMYYSYCGNGGTGGDGGNGVLLIKF